MNFSDYKEIMINNITMSKLLIDGIEIWRKRVIAKGNQVPISIDTDGSIFNGGLGYIENYRLNSSGTLTTENSNLISTGFIPFYQGDIIRMDWASWRPFSGYCYICFYDASFTLLGSINQGVGSSDRTVRGNVSTSTSITTSHGITTFNPVFTSNGNRAAYCRVNGVGKGADMVVTINEEIPLPSYKNWVYYSTENDGTTIYHEGLGYKLGYRIRSGGAEVAQAEGSCTGFIKVSPGDVIRLSGWDFGAAQVTNAINVSDSTFTNIGQFTKQPANYGILSTSAYAAYAAASVVKEKEGVWKWVVPPADSGVAYIRVTGHYSYGKMIVTINEEIV
jgi:hypothetical protein